MALKDLVIKGKHHKSRRTTENLVYEILKNYGVSAPRAISEAIVHTLRQECRLENEK